MPKAVLKGGITIDIPDEIDDIDDVPNALKALFVEKEGGAGGYTYKDPAAVKENARQIKQEKAAIASELKDVRAELDGLKKTVDPKKYALLLAKEKELEDAEAVANGQLEKIKGELSANYAAKEQEYVKRLTTTQQKFASKTRDVAIQAALAASGATESGMKYLPQLLAGQITMDWEDDEPVIKILEGGKVRYNEKADPMEIGDLIAGLRKDLPAMFKSNGASGGGGGAPDADIESPTDKSPSSWTDKQRKQYIKENGHQAYQSLFAAEMARKNAKQKAA